MMIAQDYYNLKRVKKILNNPQVDKSRFSVYNLKRKTVDLRGGLPRSSSNLLSQLRESTDSLNH